jgi:Uma2 family endonuclease
MASAPTLISIDEYLHTDYKPDVHFVNGELEERNVGKYDHGKIQGWIFQIFNLNAAAWNTDVTVEQRIQIDSSNVRIADVAIMRSDAPREEVISVPPLICVEVLSPDDRLSRARLVLADYFAMGVPNIWLIDPLRRAAFIFDAKGLHEADPTHLTVPNTPIHLDLTQAFAAID